jgi:hypothetical protein
MNTDEHPITIRLYTFVLTPPALRRGLCFVVFVFSFCLFGCVSRRVSSKQDSYCCPSLRGGQPALESRESPEPPVRWSGPKSDLENDDV